MSGEGSTHTALLYMVEFKAFRLINSPPLTDYLYYLSHWRHVASLSIFYRYFHADRYSELANCMPSPLSRPRCAILSTSSHHYSVSAKRIQNAWLTRGIISSTKHKCSLLWMYQLGTILHDIFKQYRNSLIQDILFAKSNYYRQIFCTFRINTKNIWLIFNEIKGNTCNKNIIKTLQYSNITLNKSADISEAFSNYLFSIAPELDNNLPQSNRNRREYLKDSYPNSMVFPIPTA